MGSVSIANLRRSFRNVTSHQVGLDVSPLAFLEEPPSPVDEVAFERHVNALVIHHGRRGLLFLTAAALLWWPLDWVFWADDPRRLSDFAFLRVTVTVMLIGSWAVLSLPPVRPRAADVSALLYGALMGALGYALGRMGGPELPWFTCANIVVVPAAFIPHRLPRRVMGTLMAVAPLPIAYFGSFPEYFQSNFALVQCSFLAFTAAFTLFVGHSLYGFARDSFFQVLAIERGRAALRQLNSTLEQRVSQRTEELIQLTAHVEATRDEERARISRELHDDVGQDLTALRYTLRLAQGRYHTAPETLAAPLTELSSLLERTTRTLRAVVSELRPAMLDEGLKTAVEWLVHRASEKAGIAAELEYVGEVVQLPPAMTATAYRIVQESITNVLKHASATRFDVVISASPGKLSLEVRDDGVGFDPLATQAGFGLIGMRQRASSLGGTLAIDSSSESSTAASGTVVRANIAWEVSP